MIEYLNKVGSDQIPQSDKNNKNTQSDIPTADGKSHNVKTPNDNLNTAYHSHNSGQNNVRTPNDNPNTAYHSYNSSQNNVKTPTDNLQPSEHQTHNRTSNNNLSSPKVSTTSPKVTQNANSNDFLQITLNEPKSQQQNKTPKVNTRRDSAILPASNHNNTPTCATPQPKQSIVSKTTKMPSNSK